MGNNTSHYFGAYLEISTVLYTKIKTILSCSLGHKCASGLGGFCPSCGEEVFEKEISYKAFPTWLVDEILDSEWEDVLRNITPQKLHNTGRIISVGNSLGNDGEWLYIDRYGESPAMKEFPSEAETLKMKGDFGTSYKAVIDELKRSPLVSNIEVKAGYVLDHEY